MWDVYIFKMIKIPQRIIITNMAKDNFICNSNVYSLLLNADRKCFTLNAKS